MALDALAPDQRAVVQLVLQQERSYDDLAGMLGMSPEAVRERARAGLERLGGDTGDLTEQERAELSDYLLGQSSVSRREAARSLLRSSPAARRWGRTVSAALADVARSPLPEIPEAEAEAPAAEPEPSIAVREPEAAAPVEDSRAAAEPAPGRAGARPEGAPPLRAVSPRPRPEVAGRAPARKREERERPRSSRLGGALLIGGVGILLAALVVFLFTRDGDEEQTAGNGATPTATATPGVQNAGSIPMQAPGGGKAKGAMTIFISTDGQVAFTVEGQDVPANDKGEAYAVWLVGGPRPRRLGFAPQVGSDGKLGTSGPQESDAPNFPRWFSEAKQVVVARESDQDAKQPGPIVLAGTIPTGAGGGATGPTG